MFPDWLRLITLPTLKAAAAIKVLDGIHMYIYMAYIICIYIYISLSLLRSLVIWYIPIFRSLKDKFLNNNAEDRGLHIL